MKKYTYSISVIVPLYHGKKYISELTAGIEACMKYIPGADLELIFSNDAPDEELENDFSSSGVLIRLLNTDQNRGIHGARVRGFLHSRGEYIVFLDQDDKIVPEYFQSQLDAIGSADAVVCGAISAGRLKYNVDRPLDKAANRECMVREGNMILSPGQVLIRRNAVPESWLRNIMQNNGADDWFLWLCMHVDGRQFAVNDKPLFIREVHYQNASFDSLKMAASEREAVGIIEHEKLLRKEERDALRRLLTRLQEERIKENEKFKKMFLVQNDWFRVVSRGLSVASYLMDRQVKKAAVYGYGYLGKALLEDLEAGDVEVSYVIDKNADFLDAGIRCIALQDVREQVDAVIVTLVSGDRGKLEAGLKERLEADIIWLEDIIFDLAVKI